MVRIEIEFREGADNAHVDNEAQLDASLTAIADAARSAGQMHLIGLGTEAGKSLSLVLGGDETVLIFGYPGRKPMYCHSLGTGQGLEPQLQCLHLGKIPMGIPRRLVIPMEQGLRAAREFAASGERPNSVEWEEMVD